jgi:type VI secretion system protein ImpF
MSLALVAEQHLPLPHDRLQPALLDRLTDDEPDKKLEPREARVVSKSRLRQAVLRDLVWLLNATQLQPEADLARAPHVRRSVLNFGLPALSGLTASSLDVRDLARAIREAILAFEPRILPNTLRVSTVLEPGALDHHNVIGIEIRGDLWAQPVPLEFLVRTEFDLETGTVRIADLAPARVA